MTDGFQVIGLKSLADCDWRVSWWSLATAGGKAFHLKGVCKEAVPTLLSLHYFGYRPFAKKPSAKLSKEIT